jgi:hypothetical protein
MKHTEHDYIKAGHQYERATPQRALVVAERIRYMLEAEHITDKPEARRLIDQGRQEARRQ